MPGVADEIKTKLDIVEVVGEYVQLKQSGTSLKACCPFHSEKTPSFYVSRDKQIWYCFGGCGEGGDIFSFIMKVEGMEFIEALRHLAQKAGVVLKAEDVEKRNEHERLIEANTWAAKYFHEVLLRSPKAEVPRAYIKKRALKDETVEDFLIGYAPDSWDATSIFLRKKGFKDEEMIKAGLALKRDRGPGVYDRFRNRLMFPIRDLHGHVVGFTGRVMPLADGSDPKEAKYVNTPQTELYNKSGVLFGLDRAKREIKNKGVAVVVEGNMDVIASHQAGVTNVVASSGTALTREQCDLLKRFSQRLVLSFDADAAGEGAARRGIDTAVTAGFAVRVLRLPPEAGKDPDDCIKKDPAMWTKAIVDARPFMEWYIDLAKERTDFKDPDAKKAAADPLLKEVAKFPDPVERSHWLRVLSEMFQTPESLLFEKIAKLKPADAAAVVTKNQVKKKSESRGEVVAEIILAALSSWPAMAEPVLKDLVPEEIDESQRDLYKEFVAYYTAKRHDGSGVTSFRAFLERRGNHAYAAKVAILELLAEKEFGDLKPEQRKDALQRLAEESKKLRADRRKIELMAAMAHAEKNGDQSKISEIENEMKTLSS